MTIISNIGKAYDVALSFAEEDRPFVDQVAQLLKAKGIRVFYDDDSRIHTWGRDLGHYLDKVYRSQARFCVTFVSQHYVRKRWTRFEMERAKARAFFMKHKAYILPFRFDETELPGLPDNIAYLHRRDYDAQRLTEAITGKLDLLPGRALAKRTRKFFSSPLRSGMVLATAGGLAAFTFSDNLTPVRDLARKLYQRGLRKVEGSVCRDGSLSASRGRGACAHHKGVARDTVYYIQARTMEECRQEAEAKSLFSEPE